MKKISLVILMLCFALTSFAQIKKGNLSIKTVEYGTWIPESANSGYWEMDGPPVEWIALFKISKNVIVQTTEDSKYTYFIEDSFLDKRKDRYEADIVDENGGKYLMILDNKNSNLRFIYKDGNGNLRITRFSFGSTWVEI